MDLEALESIRRLKYRYFRSLDLKQWDEFGDTFTADAIGRYGTKVYGELEPLKGRDAIVGFMSEKLGNDIITMHVASHPEIDVVGDAATASWGFEDTVIVPDFKAMIRGAGYYRDQYRREDGVWRIAETSYERIYEAMESLDDTPSHNLIANRWATAPTE
ncbi:nuclear transport factor 2 family protein [Aeromicrobium panaciterrae]|uniref:nuclear transport factor 2 family protein n=1 Tax=Aeromicrobium panaciterrae TaxID=363861 RepID=UPI0031DD9620